ncbi:MAG TPA: hypothetical protein VFC04_03040 [Actinomycetota bacterium]|jgi:hypothetical protein|nr:hypothetical protein [Actinomycetota bacterium]
MERRFELPDGISREEERAVLVALERYFLQESPHPDPWVLAGRLEATGHGALQARRYVERAWRLPERAPFVRPGVPSAAGRADLR